MNESASSSEGADAIVDRLADLVHIMCNSDQGITSRLGRIEEKVDSFEGVKVTSDGDSVLASEVRDIAAAVARIEDGLLGPPPTDLDGLKVLASPKASSSISPTLSSLGEISSRLSRIESNTAPSKDFKVFLDRMVSLEENVVDKMAALGESLTVCCERIKGLEKRLTGIERALTSVDLDQSLLRFHPEFKLKNVLLSRDLVTATRIKVDGGYYGGVVTERPLRDDEVFKVRIEEVLDDWRDWCLGIGLIRNPGPELASWNSLFWRSGTWSLWSYHDQGPGVSSTLKDNSVISSDYPMDLRGLNVGNTVGLVRRKTGDVHFFLDDADKGVAFKNVASDAHAFVDVVNYVTKISIVD